MNRRKREVKRVSPLPEEITLRSLITEQKRDEIKDRQFSLSHLGNISAVSSYNIERISIYKKMLELLPDLELAGEILVSSILNPKDNVETAINIENGSLKISDSVKNECNSIVKNELTSYYKLDKRLYDYLYEMLITHGAKCFLVFSRDDIDNFIEDRFQKGIEEIKSKHITLESLIKEFNIESKEIEDNSLITFTTDTNVISVQDVLELSGESKTFQEVKDKFYIDKLFKDLRVIQRRREDFIDSAEESQSPLSRPIVTEIPMEAVIPIINEFDPRNHLDYIILLDENGNPIKGRIDILEDQNKSVNTLTVVGKSDTKSILEKSEINSSIADKRAPLANFDTAKVRAIIDEQIRTVYEKNRGIKLLNSEFTDKIIKLMLHRVLAKQKTTLLYVKKSNLAYLAVDYKENGTGLSILDQLFYNSSIRVLLETSKVVATIRNNIPRKEYTIELDPDDQSPDISSADALEYILKSEQNILPTGLMNIKDLSRWATSIGIIARFKHPKLPNINVDYNEVTHNMHVPESDILEDYSKKAAMKFGISPEMLQAGRSPEFAIEEIYRNSLQAKRMLRRQGKVENTLDNYIRLLVRYDSVMNKPIKDILLKDAKKFKKIVKDAGYKYVDHIDDTILRDIIFEDYIENLRIVLPKPETIADGKIKDDYDEFNSIVSDFLDLRINEDALDEKIVDEFSGDLELIKSTIKGVLAEKWLERNNYMPELTSLFSSNPTHTGFNFNIFEEQSEFIRNMEISFLEYLKNSGKLTKSLQDKYSKLLEKIGDNDGDIKSDSVTTPDDNDNESGFTNDDNVSDSGDNKSETNKENDVTGAF